MGIYPVKKDCRICGGEKRGCYQSETGFFCKQTTDAPIDGRLEPFIVNGQHVTDKLQVFYKYRLKSEKREYTEAEKALWKQQQAQQLEQQKKVELRTISPLTEEQLHQEYIKLHQNHGLNQSDRSALAERGLSQETIEKRLFISLEPEQKLKPNISISFPGAKLGKLSNPSRSILTPIWNDFQGLARGAQYRNCDPNTDWRYTWASSGKHNSPHRLVNGERELPLAAIVPEKPSDYSLNFTEGGGLKPVVASELHNKIFIGAVGGNLTSSPETLKEIVEQYKSYLLDRGIKPPANLSVNYWLDAGDILNQQVLARNNKNFKLLQDLGVAVKIVWWGQITKEQNDCDEMDARDVANIEYLSQAKYLELAKNPYQFANLQQAKGQLTPITEGIKNLLTILGQNKRLDLSQFLNKSSKKALTLIPDRDFNKRLWSLDCNLKTLSKIAEALGLEHNARELHDSVVENLKLSHGDKMQNQTEKTFNSAFATESSYADLFYAIKQIHKHFKKNANYKKHKTCKEIDRLVLELETKEIVQEARKDADLSKYNPITLNSKYLPNGVELSAMAPDANFLAIVSHRGTGKTESNKALVEQAKAQNRPILFVSPTNFLGKTVSVRLSLLHKDDAIYGERPEVICPESFLEECKANIIPGKYRRALIIIDEADQIRQNLLTGATFNKDQRRADVARTMACVFELMLYTGGQIVIQSADITQNDIDFYTGLIPPERVKLAVFKNKYKPVAEQKRNLHLYQTREEIIKKTEKDIEAGKPFILHVSAQTANSRYSTTALLRHYQSLFPDKKFCVCDSQTIADENEAGSKVAKEINELYKYDGVIATSVLATGVSIDDPDKHFKNVYMLASGNGSVESVTQTLSRVRTGVDRHAFIEKRGTPHSFSSSTEIDELKAASECKNKKLDELVLFFTLDNTYLSFDEQPLGQKFTDAWFEEVARRNKQSIAYQALIIDNLLEEGWKIEYVDQPTLSEELLKGTKEVLSKAQAEVSREYCQSVIDRECPTKDEYKSLTEKNNKSIEEHKAHVLGTICKRYLLTHQNLETKEVTLELVKDWMKGKLKQLELEYYLTIGFEHAKARDFRTFESEFKPDNYFSPDATSRIISLKAELLRKCGIDQMIQAPPDKRYSQQDIQSIYELIKAQDEQFKIHFGYSPLLNTPAMTVRGILNKIIGRTWTRCAKSVRDKTGKPVKVYSYSLDPDLAIYSTIKQRWLERDKRFVVQNSHKDIIDSIESSGLQVPTISQIMPVKPPAQIVGTIDKRFQEQLIQVNSAKDMSQLINAGWSDQAIAEAIRAIYPAPKTKNCFGAQLNQWLAESVIGGPLKYVSDDEYWIVEYGQYAPLVGSTTIKLSHDIGHISLSKFAEV